MKLIDKIQKAHSNKPSDYSRLYTPTAEIIEQIADDYAIEVLEYYHNNLFNIPLKDGEAKMILNHIKNEKGL
jgi:hypothetical protein